MEFFGLNTFGASDPIKFLMSPDYKEPESFPNVVNKLEKGDYKCTITEVLRDIDIYNGIFDGYSYKSFHRLQLTKDRGYYKLIGPKDIYRDPITSSMEYGWFMNDPELKDKFFYKNGCNWPNQYSGESRYYNIARLKIKNFRL